jgi:hypothetical protein
MLDKILGGGGSFLPNLLGNYLTGRILGGKKGGNIAALGTAIPALLQQGLGSDGFSLDSLFGGGKQSDPVSKTVANMTKVPTSAPKADGVSQASSKVADVVSQSSGIDPIFTQGEGTLGIAKALVDGGFLSEGKVANFLNTKAGEALFSGLGSQVLSMFNKDDEVPTSISTPFGGEGDIRINIPNKYAAGGYIDDQYFPRRNGGIMPSEGSGQKDDVPAMLMAGEFVFTKDAVKGLGDGDSNRGIEKAYSMMNKLEDKADNYG